MKKITVIFLMFCLTGCSRAMWFSDWDKAETERKQYKALIEQNEYYERIAIALEEIAKK